MQEGGAGLGEGGESEAVEDRQEELEVIVEEQEKETRDTEEKEKTDEL